MKKIYSAPIVEIEKFDVVDIITISTLGENPARLAAKATDSKYQEAVGIQW